MIFHHRRRRRRRHNHHHRRRYHNSGNVEAELLRKQDISSTYYFIAPITEGVKGMATMQNIIIIYI